MQSYGPDKIHNVGIFGHVGSGKTTLTESLLLTAHATSRMGRVEDGSTVSDYDPDEQKRGMSINLSVMPLEWDGNKINLVDVPGFADFAGDMAAAMRVIDGAIIVLDATGGVEVGTEMAWEMAAQAKIPRMLFINKLDRDNANFFRCIEQAQEVLDGHIIPLQIPIGTGSAGDFRGIISLRRMRSWLLSDKHDGSYVEGDVPPELDAQMHEWRTQLIDKIAATTDDLIEHYLEEGEDALSRDELLTGLRVGITNGTIIPVCGGSALELVGMAQLLNDIIDCIPSAARQPIPAVELASGEPIMLKSEASEPLAALVFKTLADPYGKVSLCRVYSGTLRENTNVLNSRTRKDERIAHVYGVFGKEHTSATEIGPGDIGLTTKLTDTLTNDTLCAPERPVQLEPIEFPVPSFTATLKPHSRADLDKLGTSLARVIEEDPTLHVDRDAQTGEMLLSGLGESHLSLLAERMKRKFDTSVDMELPRIAYRESIRTRAEASYRHKKQTGGAGQFADVSLRVEPLDPDPDRTDPLEFVNEIVGGVISRGFMPAIEKGVREAMEEGLLAGNAVKDVRVSVFDGKEHPVDSKEIAFKMAGAQAFKLAALKAQPVIAEPVYILEITVPDQFSGDIMSDISTRRGRVMGMLPAGKNRTTITVQVPLAECQRYSTDLRAMTQARGSFTMTFSHYEDVPAHLVEDLVAQHTHAKELAH